MPKIRKATPVTISSAQPEQPERLWFYYGNHGPQTTPGNHSFIQSLLEHGIDVRPLFTRRTRKADQPTPECEAAVDAVLAIKRGADGASDSAAQGRPGTGLQLISSKVPQARPADAELKAQLGELKRLCASIKFSQHNPDEEPFGTNDQGAIACEVTQQIEISHAYR